METDKNSILEGDSNRYKNYIKSPGFKYESSCHKEMSWLFQDWFPIDNGFFEWMA